MDAVSMYRGTFLAKGAHSDPKYNSFLPSSTHARYTRAWCGRHTLYKWTGSALELIKTTELLIEMGLRKKASHQIRWRSIIILGVTKYAKPCYHGDQN